MRGAAGGGRALQRCGWLLQARGGGAGAQAAAVTTGGLRREQLLAIRRLGP